MEELDALLEPLVKRAIEHVGRSAPRRYQLAFCSPARAGQQRLEIKVHAEDGRGEAELRYTATHFKGGCTP